MATTRDPFTGAITFKNPNQVINTVTGQTASSLNPAVAPSNVAQVNPIPSVQMPQGGATLPDTSLANSTNAGSKVVVANAEKQLAQEQADFTARQIETEKARQKESQSGLLSIFSNRQSRQDVTAQQESRFGVDTQLYLADRKRVTAEQDSLQNEYALAVNNLEEQKSALEGQGRGIPLSLLNNQAAQMERNAAPKLNRLSAQINAKSAEGARLDGNFQLAQSLIQKSVDNILADQKDEIDIRMEFYKQNLESFDRISGIYKDAYLSNIKTLEKKYDQDREDKSSIGTLMINPDYAGAGILVTDSLEEAQTKASQWIVNNPSLDDRLKQAQINKINNVDKGNTSFDTGTPSKYSSLIDSVGNLSETTVGSESVKRALSKAIQSGDFVEAYAQVANEVEDSLKGEQKTRFSTARVDYSVMLGLKDAVQEYANSGGDMGLLTGTEESIKRKLGIDSGKATVLAVTLWREFQTYRANMTGAAFGAGESRDYAAVNPTLGKSLNLNLSVIDGAIRQLENRVTSTINTKVPSAGGLYTQITGNSSAPSSLTQQGISSTEIDTFDSTVGNTTNEGGFWSNLLKGLTGK